MRPDARDQVSSLAQSRLGRKTGPGLAVRAGKANAPQGPYTFIEEIESGTKAKVKVRDARGAIWSVKWGHEVKAEIFASRLAWISWILYVAAYFVANGKIEGVTDAGRAADRLTSDGSFTGRAFSGLGTGFPQRTELGLEL